MGEKQLDSHNTLFGWPFTRVPRSDSPPFHLPEGRIPAALPISPLSPSDTFDEQGCAQSPPNNRRHAVCLHVLFCFAKRRPTMQPYMFVRNTCRGGEGHRSAGSAKTGADAEECARSADMVRAASAAAGATAAAAAAAAAARGVATHCVVVGPSLRRKSTKRVNCEALSPCPSRSSGPHHGA